MGHIVFHLLLLMEHAHNGKKLLNATHTTIPKLLDVGDMLHIIRLPLNGCTMVDNEFAYELSPSLALHQGVPLFHLLSYSFSALSPGSSHLSLLTPCAPSKPVCRYLSPYQRPKNRWKPECI